MSRETPYHHGNLREALIASALDILAETGLAGLTLRAAAARAGVSHAAPAHHFGNLKGLLTAVATVGFERFRSRLALRADAAAREPESQLRAVMAGYVDFAAAEPELFKLVFSGRQLDWSDTALRSVADAAYGDLARVVAPVVPPAIADREARLRRLELLAWSTIHGYAHLLIAGMHRPGTKPADGPPPPPDIARLLFAEFNPRDANGPQIDV